MIAEVPLSILNILVCLVIGIIMLGIGFRGGSRCEFSKEISVSAGIIGFITFVFGGLGGIYYTFKTKGHGATFVFPIYSFTVSAFLLYVSQQYEKVKDTCEEGKYSDGLQKGGFYAPIIIIVIYILIVFSIGGLKTQTG